MFDRAQGDWLTVTVADHGVGAAGIVGTAAGPCPVKMVVDSRHGDVQVQNREGDDARFKVQLPVRV